MAKQKTAYVCSDCGSDYSKWQGQCSDCGAWNTLSEVRLGPASRAGRPAANSGFAGAVAPAQRLADIDTAEVARIGTGMTEFDRVLGGGLVPGSAILMGGNPGAGKSTLLLQTLCQLAATQPALYITGVHADRFPSTFHHSQRHHPV